MLLANGFEEMEAVVPLDILRRAGASIQTVGIKEGTVSGAHGIEIVADITLDKISDDGEMLILPGGMPGTDNLQQDTNVIELIKRAYQKGKYIAAICAAPKILGELGLLKDKRATCFPGFEKYLLGASVTSNAVEIDGQIITAKGAGVADRFGFVLAEVLFGKSKTDELRDKMQFNA